MDMGGLRIERTPSEDQSVTGLVPRMSLASWGATFPRASEPPMPGSPIPDPFPRPPAIDPSDPLKPLIPPIEEPEPDDPDNDQPKPNPDETGPGQQVCAR
ncbi:hypothetical protein CHELA20_51219 [Hyphomicrobiales bacterium]|nr:hypothetical protein CHELA41_23793 [Hyphomicrobiales bacterium]CAH1674522.1 hypothetical protein CHELA20_51219 [Hyphomicrobiales bacterium]